MHPKELLSSALESVSINTNNPLEDLTIEITNTCLLNCIHCSSEAGLESSEKLSFNDVKSLIDEFKNLGGINIEFSGGEPLLHDELSHMIKYSKKLGLKVNLFSCGVFDRSLLNSDNNRIKTKVKELKDLGVDKVFVSLLGSNEEIHNAMSQESSFGISSQFIKMLVKNDIYVGVHFVPTSINFDNVDDLIDYCSSLKVKEVGLLRFVPQGRGKKNEEILRLSRDQTSSLIELLNRELDNSNSIVRIGSHLDFCFFFRKDHDPGKCSAGISKCLVTSKGDVIPCAVFKGLPDFIAGNIRSSGLNQIWLNSSVFKILRNFNPDQMKGTCKSCQYLSRCRARCPAQRYYEWGDLYMGPDWYCLRSPRIVLCGSYGDLNRFNEELVRYKHKYGSHNVFPTKKHLQQSQICIEAHHIKKSETMETISIRAELMKRYFEKIDKSDLVVIMNEKMGKEYYGVGTTIELGYAYSHGKNIMFTLEPKDPNILSLIKTHPDQFISKCRI